MARWKTLAVYGLAFLVRMALAPFFGHSWDAYVWVKSGELFVGGRDVYSVRSLTDFPWGFYAYPPMWLYWLGISYYIAGFQNNLNLYMLVVKLPIIIADLAVAVLISKMAAEMNLLRIAGKSAILWLFNPLVILISAVWGMFDSIPVALSLWGVLMAVRRRYLFASFLFGLGAAVKIYPLLLVLPLCFYIIFHEKKEYRESLKVLSAALAGFIVPMAPYLTNPLPIIDKLLYHFGNVGSFTYWTVLSVVSPPPAIPIISYGLFLLILYLAFRKYLKERASWSVFELSAVTLLAFLATSAKVNVQYVLWILPFLLIFSLRDSGKEFRLNTFLLVSAGLLFIAAAQTALAIFDLRNIGKIVISREVQSVTFGGFILILSALLGGSRFVTLLMNLLKTGKTVWTVSRIALVLLVMVFAAVVMVFPVGTGLVLPKYRVVVGVTEGVEALFNKSDMYELSPVLDKFELTHLVFPVGPEALMYGGDYGKSFRFKLSNEAWTMEDMRNLATQLTKRGVKPLLGIYLKATYVSIHYGYHGYNSSRFITEYGDCIDGEANIYFQCVTSSGVTLARVFAERAVYSAREMGFAGVYVMGADWQGGEETMASVASLVSELRQLSIGKGFEIFVEADLLSTKDHPWVEEILLNQSDYVVVLTNPFINSLKRPLQGNFTAGLYKAHLERILQKTGGRASTLFSVHVMDIAEGWVSPALQLQVEVNTFASVPGIKGYAIYHVNRYLPVKISFK
ncbi:MAG: hypothetical protein RMI43_00015 [Candidatus Caldarchaeum sp.]|nr:hypothetical protein [Candidatus Caldarchaeum sp.]